MQENRGERWDKDMASKNKEQGGNKERGGCDSFHCMLCVVINLV